VSTDIGLEQPTAVRPRAEGAGGGRPAGQGGAGAAERTQPGQPAAQHGDVEVARRPGAHPDGVVEQRDDVTDVRPYGVCRSVLDV